MQEEAVPAGIEVVCSAEDSRVVVWLGRLVNTRE